jgi:hypothetical protein
MRRHRRAAAPGAASAGNEGSMVGLWLKIYKGQRGQALVETAIAVPLLLLLVLGIVDFGKAYNYQNDITHLANEAARYATVNACIDAGCTPIETAVKNDADTGDLRSGGGSIESPGVTIFICRPGGAADPTDPRIEAVATARYKFSVFVHTFIKRITAKATMYREQDPGPTPHYTVVDPCPY